MHPAINQQIQAARVLELTASAGQHAHEDQPRPPRHRFALVRRRRATVARPRPA